MTQSVTGCVVDETTGEPLTSPDVSLYRIGVVGEMCASLNEHGCFAFSDLPEGEYSLAFYDGNYVPRHERLTLTQAQLMNPMTIALTPCGFLSGQILDEEQRPPERCHFSLIRAGERRGESGYISDSGDHEVAGDGTFCSPPLRQARYFDASPAFYVNQQTLPRPNRVTSPCNDASSITCIPMPRTSRMRRASIFSSARRSRVCRYRFPVQPGVRFGAK